MFSAVKATAKPPVTSYVATVFGPDDVILKVGNVAAWLDGTDAHPALTGFKDPRHVPGTRRYWFDGDSEPTVVDPTQGERIEIVLHFEGLK